MSEVYENEKIFQHYLEFPAEVRTMVIEEMASEDKCRFTRCSRLSNKEVKASRNVCYGLMFRADDEEFVRVEVSYNEEATLGYVLTFREEEEEGNKKYMRYFDSDEEIEYWAVELDSSTNLPLYAAEQFKSLIQLYQRKIKKLEILGTLFHNELREYDFGIEHLENLQIIELNGNEENFQYLSKLRRPLKDLWVEHEENDRISAGYKEVYQVQEYLVMVNSTFTKEQFVQLSASNVSINIGDLTEVDVYHFIRSWQNGTLGKMMKSCSWRVAKDLNWDKTKLLRLLGVQHELDESGGFEIKIVNFKEPRSVATLQYLVFLGVEYTFDNMSINVENTI